MQGTTDGGGEAQGPRDERPWYADGLRFECTQCGNCCSGPPGAVWFDLDEAEAMARAVGVSLEVFLERYTRRIGARRWPEVVETPESWAETKRRTPCPGMDSGPVHPLVEITIGLTGA
ncbi:MAG: hypothetical protein LW636_12925 [Planctomycetaceae bacterium]|nr:hypothetical protein [Planctomycetaceae bacterium]